MPERPLDEAFARQLLKVGLVTDRELEDARQAKAKRHTPVPLAQVLVERGLLTPDQRENIERKLETQREEAKRLGPYRLVKKLGEGGMGTVYLAEGPASRTRVALKVLPKSSAKEADSLKRFLREVDAARRLNHPNIVRASGGGEDRGFHYYAMEYVEGLTLGDRLRRHDDFTPEEATRVIVQVARGLGYAHLHGVIHRDIKPDNIILALDGTAKILDMGLSKNILDAELSFRTTTGVMVGTPHYIAPEQARADQDIDGRADIYGLGATYYHLVTGETPFQGNTAVEVIAQHLNKQLPDPRDIRDGIPDGVVHVLRKMMAKEREDRYADATALIADLEAVLAGRAPDSQALDAARSTVAQALPKDARDRFRARLRRPRPAPRFSWLPLGIVGSVAAGLLLVAGIAWRSPAAPPPRAEPKAPDVLGNALKLHLPDDMTMDFICVEPGTYTRGAIQGLGTESWELDARPPHPVRIARRFHLGKYEVTRGQFALFVAKTGYSTEAEVAGKAWGRRPDGEWADIPGNNWRTPVGLDVQSDEHPVVCVSWIDASKFCGWLSEVVKREVRLPTEAEWEYACRAGTRGPWSSGELESSLGDFAWTAANSSPRTQLVGRKKPNPWGFHDMHGNVWEWCLDWSGPYVASKEPVENPRGPENGDRRVMRGGAWYLDPAFCRSSTRAHFGPSNRYTSVGFRVVLP